MKRKYADQTYLRGASQYEIKRKYLKEDNAYIVVKSIKQTKEPILQNDKTIVDNGYTIVEYSPLSKFYNARAFLDSHQNVITYYFDIIKQNGEENGRVWYDDLYLDITCKKKKVGRTLRILDENELDRALRNDQITPEDYEFAKVECIKLANELTHGANPFMKLDIKKIINNM